MKRALERVEIPHEHEARVRSWEVVRAAFDAHAPAPPRRSWRPLVAVVVLRHLLGYTPGQIAGLLDLPRGTVNSRLRRALDALAEELGP